MDFKELDNFYYCTFGLREGEVNLEFIDKKINLFEVTRGLLKPKDALQLKIVSGEIFNDFLTTNDGFCQLISGKLKNLLKEENLEGWDTYPVCIDNVDEKYFGLQITGRSGSLITPKEKGFYKGYKFDPNSWDGSDIFSPLGTANTFCTEKFAQILQKNKIKNALFKKLSDVEAYSLGHE